MEELVVVDVEEPVDAERAALAHRAAHLPLLPRHQRVVVVLRVGAERGLAQVRRRRHRDEVGKLGRREQLDELGRGLDVDEGAADPERATCIETAGDF